MKLAFESDGISIAVYDSVLPLMQQLGGLLCDCVETGASIGFVAPLSTTEAQQYWLGLEQELQQGRRQLLLAFFGDRLVGVIQLVLCDKDNAGHRGEVEKLMVHSNARGQGIAKQLLAVLEQQALFLQRTLLVLDTRKGDVAENLYRSLDYVCAGEIPGFTKDGQGRFESTLYFYKNLHV